MILSKNPGRSVSFTAFARSALVTATTLPLGPRTASSTSPNSLRKVNCIISGQKGASTEGHSMRENGTPAHCPEA